MTVLYFLLTLGIIVLIHEFGHFYFARRAGVKVEVFSIMFGNPIFKWKDKLGTSWQIGWIPLGGYVKLYGQSDLPDSKELNNLTQKQKSENYQFKSWWNRFKIIFGGVLFNFVSAFIIIFSLFYFKGVPQNAAIVSSVAENMPAQIAGMKSGDIIIKYDDIDVKTLKDLQKQLNISKDKTSDVVVKRDNKNINLKITPALSGKHFIIGIASSVSLNNLENLSFVNTLKASGKEFYTLSSSLVVGLKQLIMGERSSKELGGFLSIAKISKESADNGLYSYLFFIAFISINLGILNLFPIPVLDGGHIVFLIYEAVFKRPISAKIYNILAWAGLLILLFLLVISNLNDILRALK